MAYTDFIFRSQGHVRDICRPSSVTSTMADSCCIATRPADRSGNWPRLLSRERSLAGQEGSRGGGVGQPDLAESR